MAADWSNVIGWSGFGILSAGYFNAVMQYILFDKSFPARLAGLWISVVLGLAAGPIPALAYMCYLALFGWLLTAPPKIPWTLLPWECAALKDE